MSSSNDEKMLETTQDTPTINESTPQERKKFPFIRFGLILVLLVVIQLWSKNEKALEYTNNRSSQLPVIVTGITLSGDDFDFWDYVTLQVKNTTDSDYRNVTFAILAWDTNGFPVKIKPGGGFNINAASDYIGYITLENLSALGSEEPYSCFDFNDAEVAYMSAFLAESEDFENNTWISPAMDIIEDERGKKIEDTELSYFVFEQ